MASQSRRYSRVNRTSTAAHCEAGGCPSRATTPSLWVYPYQPLRGETSSNSRAVFSGLVEGLLCRTSFAMAFVNSSAPNSTGLDLPVRGIWMMGWP